MNLRPLLFVFGSLLIGTLPGAETTPSTKNQDTQARIVFPNATINGQPARLLLDTGSQTTLLIAAAASRLGVKTAVPSANSTVLLKDQTHLAQTEPVRLTISGETFTTPLLLLPILDAPFDGLIGWPEVRDNILIFDPIKHTVSSAPQLPTETASWTKLKLHPGALLLLEVSLSNGTIGEIAVDTGSDNGVVLPKAQWLAWKQAHPDVPISSTAFIMPGSIGMRTEKAQANEVTLGPLKFTDVPVSEASPAESAAVANYIGTLGLSALARMDFVVDGKNDFAYLKPKTSSPTSSSPATHETTPSPDWTVDKTVRLKVDLLRSRLDAAKK